MPSPVPAAPSYVTAPDRRAHPLAGYAVALLCAAVAVIAGLLLQDKLGGFAGALLLIAVVAAAAFGGPGPGLCATGVVTAAVALWLGAHAAHPVLPTLVVGICGVAASLLVGPRGRAARRSAEVELLEIPEPASPWSPLAEDPGAAAEADRLAAKVAGALDERLEADRRRAADEARFRALLESSDVAVWRFHHDQPVDTSLPEDEQIEQLYQVSYLAECNDATARMYGFSVASDIVGTRLAVFLSSADPENLAYLRRFIRSGYRLEGAESHEVDRHGNRKYFVNDLVGIVDGGHLLGAWGTQRDVTEERSRGSA